MKNTVNSQLNFSGSSSSGTVRSTSSSSKKKTSAKNKKKKLNYNYRDVSSQILRAKKLQSANEALSRAKSKMVSLQKSKASGQYDNREVDAAIAHAKRMVRCARMKVNNMREEKFKENSGKRESHENRQKVKRTVAKSSTKKQAEKKNELKEAEVKIRKLKQEIMEQKRRIKNHRLEEQAKVFDANMKYIKEGGNSYSGVEFDPTAIMELSAMASYLISKEQQIDSDEIDQQFDTASDVNGSIDCDGSIPIENVSGTVTVSAAPMQASVETVTVDVAL